MGNRVEDLEKQVAELQATVDGLTEELVETKERLRTLEQEGAEPAETDGGDDGDAHAEFVANEDTTPDVDPAGQSESGSEASATEETRTTEEEHDDGDDDDIIVA